MDKSTSTDIKIKTKDETAKGIQSAKQKVGGLTKAVKAYGAEIAAVYLAVRKAYKIVQDLTQAWGVQEVAIIEMNNALINTGIYTPQVSDELQNLASRLQTVTTFGDELTLSAIAMLQSLGELDQEMLKRAIPAVQDLAASLFKGDMITASSMFAKVVGSSTNSLSRYGIEIDMTGTKAEKFEELMGKVNLKFGGRAAGLADSYTGKIKQLGNAYGDLKEAMGHVMANQMEPAIPLMMEITTQLTDWINKKIALKEAYEDIKKPMQDANDQMRIELLQAQQLVAINTLRILLANTQDAQYTVMGFDLKKLNEERDREISRLQAIISGSERELKAIMDLIKARDEEIRQEEERKKKKKETKIALDELIVSTDEWANTIVWTGQALDDYLEMLESEREGQQNLNEKIKEGVQDLTDYAAAMRRLEDKSRIMKTDLPEITNQLELLNEQAREMAAAIEGPWSRSWELMGDSTKSGAEKIKQVMKDLFSDMFRMFAEEMLFLAMRSFIPGLTFNPAAGVGYMAASAFAFAAAGFVQSLKGGGDFITRGPQLLLVGDNPSGREHVRVDPLGGGGGPSVIVNVYGSVQTEKDLAQTIAREIGRQGYSVT